MITTKLIFDVLCVLLALNCFVLPGIALYLGYAKRETIRAALMNTPRISTHALRGQSRLQPLALVAMTTWALTFPRFHVRHGLLDRADLRAFPIPLRRKLVALGWTFLGHNMAMLAAAVIIGLRGTQAS